MNTNQNQQNSKNTGLFLKLHNTKTTVKSASYFLEESDATSETKVSYLGYKDKTISCVITNYCWSYEHSVYDFNASNKPVASPFSRIYVTQEQLFAFLALYHFLNTNSMPRLSRLHPKTNQLRSIKSMATDEFYNNRHLEKFIVLLGDQVPMNLS